MLWIYQTFQPPNWFDVKLMEYVASDTSYANNLSVITYMYMFTSTCIFKVLVYWQYPPKLFCCYGLEQVLRKFVKKSMSSKVLLLNKLILEVIG